MGGVLGTGTDRHLLSFLDRIAKQAKMKWLSFANGGDERWTRSISVDAISGRLAEQSVLAIHREHRKDGGIVIHLVYPTNEDVLPCEVFRNTLKLPSCPDKIEFVNGDSAWRFSGVGAGHGEGLSVARAQMLSVAGRTAEEILVDAYGDLRE